MELAIRMWLVVVVLSFTIAMGYNALDAYQALEEETAAAQTISEILLKARIVEMGGEGAREIAEFEIKGGSRLKLVNEDFNGTVNGIVDVELSRGGRMLKVLPLPLWDSNVPPLSNGDLLTVERVFLSGSHKIVIMHMGSLVNSSVGDFLLIG
jgi:hypothetical protein